MPPSFDSQRPLRCLGWEGYADDVFHAPLAETTGVRLTYEDHLSDDLASRQLLAEPERWDVVNINTPFVRDCLDPAGLIHALGEPLIGHVSGIVPPFERFVAAAFSADRRLLGVPQRCGPFNLVVNQRALAPRTAETAGFGLALEPDFFGRYGVLAYEDFNVMHIAIAAGLDPFKRLSEAEMALFHSTAGAILGGARLYTADHSRLNRLLIDREIDFYVSGGTYTISPARRDGHREVMAVTPAGGPIEGRGAICFVEINALVQGSKRAAAGEALLEFMCSPAGAAAASRAAGSCNPVAQMGEENVRAQLSADELAAMQWDTLEEDLSRCADYGIMPDYEALVRILRSAVAA